MLLKIKLDEVFKSLKNFISNETCSNVIIITIIIILVIYIVYTINKEN